MDTKKYLSFWSKVIHLPLAQFRKPYIKKVKEKDITRKGRFGYGTCNVIYENILVSNDVLMGIKYLQDNFK